MKQAAHSDKLAYELNGGAFATRKTNKKKKRKSDTDTNDVYATQIVRVANSEICDGLGLFAQRCIPRGSYITAYAGRRITNAEKTIDTRSDVKRTRDYDYVIDDDGITLDGTVPGSAWWSSHGVCQIANDAIDRCVTCKDNNCEFREVDVQVSESCSKTRVFLVASRDIQKDEELLVSYSLGYWLGRAKYRKSSSSIDLTQKYSDVLEWLNCHLEVQNILRTGFAHDCWIRELVRSTSTFTPDDLSEKDPKKGRLSGVISYVVKSNSSRHSNCTCPMTEEDDDDNIHRVNVHLSKSFNTSGVGEGPLEYKIHCGRCASVLFVGAYDYS